MTTEQFARVSLGRLLSQTVCALGRGNKAVLTAAAPEAANHKRDFSSERTHTLKTRELKNYLPPPPSPNPRRAKHDCPFSSEEHSRGRLRNRRKSKEGKYKV
uniref:Uncharacterized protein n=1 Tax=Knipowitschia caucasica TaxID=637954 RepID=A0AAV2J471_KNICA